MLTNFWRLYQNARGRINSIFPLVKLAYCNYCNMHVNSMMWIPIEMVIKLTIEKVSERKCMGANIDEKLS